MIAVQSRGQRCPCHRDGVSFPFLAVWWSVGVICVSGFGFGVASLLVGESAALRAMHDASVDSLSRLSRSIEASSADSTAVLDYVLSTLRRSSGTFFNDSLPWCWRKAAPAEVVSVIGLAQVNPRLRTLRLRSWSTASNSGSGMELVRTANGSLTLQCQDAPMYSKSLRYVLVDPLEPPTSWPSASILEWPFPAVPSCTGVCMIAPSNQSEPGLLTYETALPAGAGTSASLRVSVVAAALSELVAHRWSRPSKNSAVAVLGESGQLVGASDTLWRGLYDDMRSHVRALPPSPQARLLTGPSEQLQRFATMGSGDYVKVSPGGTAYRLYASQLAYSSSSAKLTAVVATREDDSLDSVTVQKVIVIAGVGGFCVVCGVGAAYFAMHGPQKRPRLFREVKALLRAIDGAPVTILFADIVGLSRKCSDTPPEKLVESISIVFQRITNTIQDYKGTVDKFMGGSLMAIWNEPEPVEHYNMFAVTAAIACSEEASKAAADLAGRGLPPIDVRFGLSTGECLVGNTGTEQNYTYTAIGATVTEAKKIESVTRVFNATTMISHELQKLVADDVLCRYVRKCLLKGVLGLSMLYEAVCPMGKATPEQRAMVHAYEKVVSTLERAGAQAAISSIEEYCKEFPKDGVGQALLEECKQMLSENVMWFEARKC
eukprot:m51a1_g1738 hypothetical protein (660) ;mRNA; r:169733-172345